MPRGPDAPISAAVSIHCCGPHGKSVECERKRRIAAGGAQQRTHSFPMRSERLKPAHHHVKQSLARRLLRHVAQIGAKHDTVNVLGVGRQDCKLRAECTPQLLERNASLSAISASPISSIGFSASSAKKAATIFSRSLVGAAAGVGVDERAAGLRAGLRSGLRAMSGLLGMAQMRD